MVVEVEKSQKCPACGTPLSRDRWSAGLCPPCVFELALDDTGLEAELLVEPGEAPTLQFSAEGFSEGDIQGDRYRIRSLLGRGGMGEVWRAYDLKLRQDVALKALRTELTEDQAALEILRQEVRVAREVISPNVCRVFDLQELDGKELISMEYVDGTTLQEILRDRGPLELNEAREIATQVLAGLEAIHEAGLVHRDIKPENIMITRTGRVVVMDFGIAKGLGEGKSGVVAGTPAYMSPEQARGQELDARTDLFSAGVVLAEMVQPGGIGSFEDRRRVWEQIHQSTPQISETPWSKVIAKAVSAETEDRFESAAALARALEEVTLRAAGDETARPYPGLSAFQQEDAEYFYGRELEVEALWKKLRRPHLLGVIGPSGAGKSSFLRAGLLPTLTDGWQAVISTPGNRPFANLARALAEQLPQVPDIVDALLRFEETEVAVDLIRQWRQGHKHGLIILDQFEELFTQNPEGIQQALAELLGSVPLEADVFVLLSMRDDFLHRCSELESLAPVFSELSPLKSLSGASLRRAIVEPALKCGYRFEDESIVEEMLGEVEGQRGALPLLAFAAAQLWERRDRESGLLTQKAYEQIGGVSGALAQHAEAMLDYIGEANVPIVRELFRNLVTAQGTRAARDREELLSVFPEGEGEPFLEPSKLRPTSVPKPQRPAAKHVLNSLIDARLLTSYEIAADEEGGKPPHRIEIVHESLLANWPRLVRWQTQDAEGAQLRDELRSQAKLWEEHGRSEDYLWTGTAFKEYELWRERYPGGLSATEEAYAEAMETHARRRQRRRRLAVAATIAFLLVVVVVISGLWVQSRRSERQALAAARRAEASKLFALGQLEEAEHPTAALAYALKSLELADSPEVRRFALQMLWRGPTAFVVGTEKDTSPLEAHFSPDGKWLVRTSYSGRPRLWASDGSEPRWLEGHETGRVWGGFSSDSRWITTVGRKTIRWWSLPAVEEVRHTEREGEAPLWEMAYGDYLLEWIPLPDQGDGVKRRLARGWPMSGGEPETLGLFHIPPEGATRTWYWIDTDPVGQRILVAADDDLWELPLRGSEVTSPRLILQSSDPMRVFDFDHETGRLVSEHTSGVLRFWSPSDSGDGFEFVRALVGDPKSSASSIDLDPHGRWLAVAEGFDQTVALWELAAPPNTSPLVLRRGEVSQLLNAVLHPSGEWLATSDSFAQSIWPLTRAYPRVIGVSEALFSTLAFHPEGEWLAALSSSASLSTGGVWIWPLSPTADEMGGEVFRSPCALLGLDVSPSGDLIAVGSLCGEVFLLPPSGAPVRKLAELGQGPIFGLAFDPQGLRLAVGGFPDKGMVRVWNLESEEVQVLDPGRPEPVVYLEFTPDGRLLSGSMGGGMHLWDLEDATSELLFEGGATFFRLSVDGRFVLGARSANMRAPSGKALVYDLEKRTFWELETHGEEVSRPNAHPTAGVVITPSRDGSIRVGPMTGEEPHLLLGHEGMVWDVAVDPSGRWIASAGVDGTVRLWPMPQGQPFHTLPYDELLERLRSLTNYRIVEDEGAPSGYRLDFEPFEGWNREPPTW